MGTKEMEKREISEKGKRQRWRSITKRRRPTAVTDIRRLRCLIQCKATDLSLARGLGCSGITPGSAHWTGRSVDFPTQRHLAYDHMSAKESMAKLNGSQARDPVKGAKAKYQLAVTKEPPLRMIVEMDAYKATLAKIEAYGEKYRRFEGLRNSADVEGCSTS